MIFFLLEYEKLKDKSYFEECFGYAVYDMINNIGVIKSDYDLETIAKEAFLIDSEKRLITKQTLKKISKNIDLRFVNGIRGYFAVFYKSGRKTG